MIVKFPIALFTVGFAALIAFLAVGDAFWYRAAYLAMLTGGAIALIAIPIGALDLAKLPRDTRAKQTGFAHAGAAVAATIFFAGSGFSLRGEWLSRGDGTSLGYGIPLVFAIAGFGVLVLAGVLGWRMVGVHHAGISPVPGHRDHIELPAPLTHTPRHGSHRPHGAHA